MERTYHNQLVYTVQDKCRVCYTCVRNCPVKAIRINNGQAEIINERCIGCGICTRVCSQHAKLYLQSTKGVERAIRNSDKTRIAIVAPSFPAEFIDYKEYKEIVGMIRAVGFDVVSEVSFGADIVARKYKEFVERDDHLQGGISSDCPAVTFYIKQYHPDLVENLIPVVSPMVAMARVMRHIYGNACHITFIGPCIAKKAESPEVNESITFVELRKLFIDHNITPENSTASDFNPPHGGKGSIFPVSHGLLQTAGLNDDITVGNVVVADGHEDFIDAIKEYENGEISANHLELLCCNGCIMGPGMSPGGVRYARRFSIAEYVREKLANFNETVWEREIELYEQLDFSITFTPQDRRIPRPSEDEIEVVLQRIGKTSQQDHLNCGACGYDTCREHAIAIVRGHAESEMCLPFTINSLHSLIQELNVSNDKLKMAQDALKQSEKLAHMGQLSAGIAHELNNPLGVITMYSNLLKDECPIDDTKREDLDLIVEQAERCRKIVKGLLNFARKNQVNLAPTDMEAFVKSSINSIIHPENIKISFESRLEDLYADIDPDQLMQVLTNLEKNGVEAMSEKGGELKISIEEQQNDLCIVISDTGSGISKENMEKIFTPFFTTKGVGKGTGLGLSLIYGIVKMHKGRISVSSNDNLQKGSTGTSFRIVLPRKSI